MRAAQLGSLSADGDLHKADASANSNK